MYLELCLEYIWLGWTCIYIYVGFNYFEGITFLALVTLTPCHRWGRNNVFLLSYPSCVLPPSCVRIFHLNVMHIACFYGMIMCCTRTVKLPQMSVQWSLLFERTISRFALWTNCLKCILMFVELVCITAGKIFQRYYGGEEHTENFKLTSELNCLVVW
jgi:hypothetical protein